MSNTFIWLKNEKVLKGILQKVSIPLLPLPAAIPSAPLVSVRFNTGNRNHSGYLNHKRI